MKENLRFVRWILPFVLAVSGFVLARTRGKRPSEIKLDPIKLDDKRRLEMTKLYGEDCLD